MNDIIYGKIKKSLEEKKILTNDKILNYMYQRKDEEDIGGYINSLTLSKIGSYYNSINGDLGIDVRDIFYNRFRKIPDINSIINIWQRLLIKPIDANVLNLYILFSINHEVMHAIQQKIICEEPNDDFNKLQKALLIKDEEFKSIDENYFYNFFYKQFHDYFFSEYNANINSYIETLYLVNSFNIKELRPIIKKYNNLIARHILYLYHEIYNPSKVTNPCKNFRFICNYIKNFSEINKQDINISNNFSSIKTINKPNNDFDRLRLGLNISKNAIKYIEDVSSGKEKTLNLFENIRTI